MPARRQRHLEKERLVSTPETILQQMQTSFQYEFPHLQLHVTPRLES